MSQKQFDKDYLNKLGTLLEKIDANAITMAIECLRDACNAQRTIYICGNGGSASIASQMVADIVKFASIDREPRFRMVGLTDNVATITAYANDVGYNSAFVEQLKNFAQKDDVLIAISGSGCSESTMKAVEYANKVGCTSIGLTSSINGHLKDVVTIPISVPSDHMGQLEDTFFIATHIMCYAFIEKVF